MSKTYEALKKAEAEKNRRAGGAEKEESNREEPLQPAGAVPNDEASLRSNEHFSSSSVASAEGETQDASRSSATTTDDHLPPTNGYPFSLPRSVEEQYQRLYTGVVVQAQTSKPLQTLMIVGADHGDGVTTSASLFARVLAKSRTVLLVDANLRTPALADVFHLRSHEGFSDFLARKVSLEGAIVETDVPNLFIMTCGSAPLAPPYLFEAGPFDELLTGLKEKFDYIIFDAAPLGLHLDSTFLASRVDGVILVLKAESTQVQVGQEIKKRLEEAGARILGVVVNQTQDYVPPLLRRLLA